MEISKTQGLWLEVFLIGADIHILQTLTKKRKLSIFMRLCWKKNWKIYTFITVIILIKLVSNLLKV